MTSWITLKLKTKLLLLTAFMSAIILVVSVNSYMGLKKVNQSTKDITEISIPNLLSFSKMDLAFRSLRIELRTLGLPDLTQAQKDETLRGITKYIEEFEAAKKEYLKLDFLDGEKELFEPLAKEWEDFKVLGGEILKYNASPLPQDKEKMINIFKIDCPRSAERVSIVMLALNNFHQEVAKKFIQAAEEKTAASNLMNLTIGAIGIFLGIVIGYIVSNKTSESISKLASSLFANSERVANASTQIATSSTHLSEAATEQSASLEETAASLEEITAMIKKAAESANQTFSSSEQSQQKANQGRGAVDEMVQSMEQINQSNQNIMNQINTSNEQLGEIVKVIQEIGTKTKVINDIVFQTKLLSFNASVEAARAGEHGKGFAVVAEEVGNLAQMSGNAAKEISEMLDGSIHKVESIVKDTKSKVEGLVDTGKSKVDQGMRVASNCSNILSEIVQNVSHVSNLAREISQATKEQSQGVEEINKAMAQLDSVTQQNTTSSNEAALEAQGLSTSADELKSLIQDLVFTVEGKTSSNLSSNVSEKRVAAKPAQKNTKIHQTLKNVTPITAANNKTKSYEASIPNFDDPRFKEI